MKISDLSAEELNELLHTVSLDTCPKLESAEIERKSMNKYEAIVRVVEILISKIDHDDSYYTMVIGNELTKLVDGLIKLKEPE